MATIERILEDILLVPLRVAQEEELDVASRQSCVEMRNVCIGWLKSPLARIGETHPLIVHARSLLFFLMDNVRKPDLDDFPREELPVGPYRFVPGVVERRDDTGYVHRNPGLIFAATYGSVEKATAHFLEAGLSEHLALGRNYSRIDLGKVRQTDEGLSFPIMFRRRTIRPVDVAYWQKKLTNFKPTDIF